jgi:pyruvate dehydrogenase E1 component alpha subunit
LFLNLPLAKKIQMPKKRITKDVYLKWYEDMLFWRKFEDMSAALYIQQKIRGFLHLYNGQEAVLAGSLLAMEQGDKMITAYRNHVQPIGLGVDPRKIMAELMGRVDGTSHGKGGSMHMFSKEHHFYGGHGIVGGQIPLGAGLAFADKYLDQNHVTLTYMGDGAIRQGSFHETLNLAMLWNLPVVFIIENNGYAMGTSVQRTSNHTDLYKLGLGYEMPCAPVDGMHPEAVYEAVYEAVQRARKGGGPSLLEIKTYRYKGHSMSDAQHYRTKDEVAEYQKLDPITQVHDILIEKKWASKEDIDTINARVKDLVKECVDFADASPYAPAEYVYKGVYAQDDYPFIKE